MNICISLTSKAIESNFYTTPRRMVVSGSFLHRARVVERRGQGENAGRSCTSQQTGGLYLILKEWKALGEETEAG